MRKSYFSDRDFRRNRAIAIIVSLLLHGTLVVGLFFYQQQQVPLVAEKEEDLNFGSSGGGGAENANDTPVEFGAHQPTQEDYASEKLKKSQLQLIDIHILVPEVPVLNATPVPKVEEEKPKIVQRKKKPRPTIIAENLPIGHVRHGGQGPGSGGGMGGGSGGGIGARVGYSIDWGGTGSRRLLSGRIPKYPEGLTDKQMTVVLQFTVLPDGYVDQIVPLRKTDEILEHAAIAALQTWRFEPLPSQVEQRKQFGKVPFTFTLKN